MGSRSAQACAFLSQQGYQVTNVLGGTSGFIGSNLANFYSQQYQVFVIDDLSMGRVKNLQQTEQLVFIKGSVTDQQLLDEVLSKHSFEY
ncbi:GDP-mannose 4,6-dehydratase, partial [Enterococcus faecalis]|uniref:GDP-mannose 4,6-dehydratase n=1 Tax=Enterococcus faecalis TaxID=1351 RepID=UPI001F49D681